MSEKSEQGIDEQQVQPLSHKRILILMACAVLFGSILCSVFVSVGFGVGVLIGGVLSLVNYYWLKRSLKVIFDEAVAGEKPQFLTARYFMRYLALGAALAVVYLTQLVPIVAVLIGLASFAAAIVIEGFIRLFNSFSNR
ncbi:MAG: ATP synthase subunit I [Acidobacteria bacterium]|nr:ATP synthase subunit I [Acidobacteriota bacterium]